MGDASEQIEQALQGELNQLMKQHRSDEMAALIDDEILHTFAVVGAPDAVVEEMLKRYGDLIDRTSFYAPSLGDSELARLLAKLRG